jgi:diguanylate cyclase (GGDEF)-like protein
MVALISSNPRRLWLKYIVALAVILFFIICSHLIHASVLSEGAKDTKTINKAGQQRMLSQRIAFFSSRLSFPEQSNQLAENQRLLESAINKFESNHNWILENSIKTNATKQMYFSKDGPQLDQMSRDFVFDARKVLSETNTTQAESLTRKILELAKETLLVSLDNAVTLFASEAESKSARLEQLQLISLIIAIVTIVAEAFFIFLPAQKSITRALDLAEDQNRNINEQNNKLVDISRVLNHEVNHDALTGLKNRRAIKEDLDNRIQAFDPGSQLFIIMVDMDDFKEVNGTFGYPIGDLVLQHVADLLKSIRRDYDMIARVGGDEFVLLIESSGRLGENRIQKLADDIISELKKPISIHGNEISVCASIGYSVAEELPIDAVKLISNADIALRRAKSKGKGIACAYNVEMRVELEELANLLIDITRAINHKEFVPYLQPQVNLDTGQLIGFEVLGRWKHPEKGILSPAAFIPMAEDVGLIDQIDEQIALAGLNVLALLRSEGYQVPKISINMSARSLRKSNFCGELTNHVSALGLLPSDVLVEILETTLIERTGDQVISTVSELSDAGFGAAMDDFGTGFSSLSMITKLDLSELKIDKSLVDDIGTSKGDEVLIAIIALAKRMNLTVVAEGIETAQQFSNLKLFGCDVGQGYKIGYPMSESDVRLWIKNYGKVTRTQSRSSFEKSF